MMNKRSMNVCSIKIIPTYYTLSIDTIKNISSEGDTSEGDRHVTYGGRRRPKSLKSPWIMPTSQVSSALKVLNEMVNAGLIVPIGRGKNTEYRLYESY